MTIRFVFLGTWLLTGTASYGQTAGPLRTATTQAEAAPASPRRDSVRYHTYLALSSLYWLGNSEQPANHDSAVYFATKAIAIAPTPRLRADALRQRGALYHANTLGFNAAWMGLDDLNEAANAFIALRDTTGLQKVCSDLSTFYLIRYNPENKLWANNLYYSSLAMRVQSDSAFRWPARIAAPATDTPATRTQILENIRATEQNMAYWVRNGSKQHVMWRAGVLGELYHQSGIDKAKGARYTRQALDIALALPDIHIAYASLTSLSQWALEAGQLTESLAYARQGLRLSLREKTIPRQAMFHDRLYHTFRAMRLMDSAYAHKDITIAINDSLSHVGDQRQIDFLKEKVAAERRERDLETQLQRRNSLLGWLVGLGTLLLSTLLFFGWRNRLLRRKNNDLQTAMLRGQTLERQRVAADLHDTLGATLSSLQWTLQAIDKQHLSPTEQTVYQTIQQQLTRAHADVRLLSHNLLPAELATEGLPTALQRLVKKLNDSTPTHFALVLPDPPPRFGPQVEFELYSICLELTNNILKHAKATEALIRLRVQNDTLTLTLSDDGTGLGETGQEAGRGLQNVAARVAALGGTWATESEAGQGVTHRIVVPISAT
jgi:signal transduction histidine kinase